MSDLIGKTIGKRYSVESFLGKGGMAEVYKAWDRERNVYLAMKVLYADLAEDRVFLRRFKREAQTLAKLQHPNIVRFYGMEQDEDLVYMLMDYVEGATLRKEIFQADAPLSMERIQNVMKSACSALYYAHKSGFVHCDIKPANIMSKPNGDVLIADFGISRMTEASTVTMVGAGTPAYMSPEQIKGEAPAPQMDIYSLGIVLFEMLTGGERPFTGENAKVTGGTSEKIRWEQMRLPAPPPSQYNSSIPSGLDKVVLKCLDKSPKNRYLSAMDLYGDLILPGNVLEPQKPVTQPASESLNKEKQSVSTQSSRYTTKLSEPEKAKARPQKKEEVKTIEQNPSFTQSPLVWVMVLIAVILFIAVVSGTNFNGGSSSSSFDSTDTEFIFPTDTPMPTMVSSGWVDIFSDTFDIDKNNWTVGSFDNDSASGNRSISNGKFVWLVTAKDGFIWRNYPSGNSELNTDILVEVDVEQTNGDYANSEYGISFNFENDNFYKFTINGIETQYSLSFFNNDNWETLIPSTESLFIKPGETNRLSIHMTSGNIFLYINGQYVDEAPNRQIGQGYAGIAIGLDSAGDEGAFEFDNFKIRVPAEAASAESLPVATSAFKANQASAPTSTKVTTVYPKEIIPNLLASTTNATKRTTIRFRDPGAAKVVYSDGSTKDCYEVGCTYEWSINGYEAAGGSTDLRELVHTFYNSGSYRVSVAVCLEGICGVSGVFVTIK